MNIYFFSFLLFFCLKIIVSLQKICEKELMKLYTDEELAAILDQELFHQIGEAADRLGVEC